MAGRPLSEEDCDRLWRAWTPAEVADRLAGTSARWYVAAGWALDLFVGGLGRDHDDLEIGVPRERFADIAAAFPDFEWDVVGNGQVWPFPEEADSMHQTWLRDPATGHYHLDVFREPHRGDHWICRRDALIGRPYDDLIMRTDDGIPYVIPEVVLLFKAKAPRTKDQSDFRQALPMMDATRRSRLAGWLSRVHPGHPWLELLGT